MLKVLTAQNPIEAGLVRAFLANHGIDAEIRGEALFSTLEGGPSASGMLPSLWVFEQYAPKASELITAFLRGDSTKEPGGEWQCLSCSEVHESQFTNCWKCGASKPASGAA